MSVHAMSNAISSKFLTTETDNEGQNSTPLPYGWRLPQPNDSSYADAMTSPPMHRAQSVLAPFPEAVSALAPTLDYLSTGAPRLVPVWMRCCECENLVNPSLAAEEKCPICSHSKCRYCTTETVP
ncbi:hypothetical protein PITC_077900 [Penicillium italicum]|uniref:Uncharacterized protein n=1 Tax=Penicillium italicum TaxID=40296 RepID=A0A0A2KM42_PENIT|nr:hypothetical protein PITC_077900 [Penicillium italicum]